jgi:hypothetical protein
VGNQLKTWSPQRSVIRHVMFQAFAPNKCTEILPGNLSYCGWIENQCFKPDDGEREREREQVSEMLDFISTIMWLVTREDSDAIFQHLNFLCFQRNPVLLSHFQFRFSDYVSLLSIQQSMDTDQFRRTCCLHFQCCRTGLFYRK